MATPPRVERPRYDEPVDAVLSAIGSPEGAPGSGSAAALALSIAVECVALHARLTLRSGRSADRAPELERLLARLASTRTGLRVAFEEDARRVEAMVEARRSRDAAPPEDRPAAVRREVEAMHAANRGLVELLGFAEGVLRDAEWLVEGPGVRYALSESATARALARAVLESVRTMLGANLEAIDGRRAEEGVDPTTPVTVPAALPGNPAMRPGDPGMRPGDPEPLSVEALTAALDAWDDAGLRGLCGEGRLEVALDVLRGRGVRVLRRGA